MTTCHFVTDADFSLLSKIYSYSLIHPGRKLVTIILIKYLNVYNNTAFAVRHLQGSIANFARFFPENCTKESFLGSKLGFALGSNLAYKYIASMHLSSDMNNTVLA